MEEKHLAGGDDCLESALNDLCFGAHVPLVAHLVGALVLVDEMLAVLDVKSEE